MEVEVELDGDDVILRKFFEELGATMESKIIALCSDNNEEERKKTLLARMAQLYPQFLSYLLMHVFPVQGEKELPVSLDNFSDGKLDQIDEILEKIIRQRAYKKDLQEKIKQAKLDLDSLETINKSFKDHSLITENAVTSFELAHKMYNNIEISSPYAENQGLLPGCEEKSSSNNNNNNNNNSSTT